MRPRCASVYVTLLWAVGIGSACASPLCKGLPECHVQQTWPAGGSWQIVETRRPAQNAYEMECIDGAREFWLQSSAGDPVVPRRVLRLCNDGYGASGIGEDTVEVEAGKLIHSRYGGSNWRTLTRTEIALDPVSITQVQTDSMVGTAVGCQRHLELPASAKRLSWLEAVQTDEDAVGGDCDFERSADSLDIPQLSSGFLEPQEQARLAAEFAEFKQARHTLGDCALQFGTEQLPAAHVLHGKIDTSQPVQLKVLALDEVHWVIGVHAPARDPQTAPGKWIHQDRLELWLGGFLFTWPEDVEQPVQYGVVLADAQVHAGAGAVAGKDLPQVEQWQSGGWRWYAIDFSAVRPDWKVFSATVVYGEGDGRKQGLMLANSRLQFRQPATLGGLWNDYSHQCEIRDGALVRTRLLPRFADPDHVDPLAAGP